MPSPNRKHAHTPISQRRPLPTAALRTVADLIPDSQNPNRGTPRGRAMLDRSLRTYGAGRSILTDRDGRVIAGNKTVEQAAEGRRRSHS